jgi:alkanesulfonate monooxygenase SsuD/methylene tetrahydromethanopterin reductase-like flavin-dependent oxidoreductase (luciferase family)
VRAYTDPVATASEWRALAERQGLSLRELIIEVTGRHAFVGTPAEVAQAINDRVQGGAADGFILAPHVVPGGLDEFADTVVPLLQERGVFRAEYEGGTLRDRLGLPPIAVTGAARGTRRRAG